MIGAIQNNYYIDFSKKKKEAQNFKGGFTDLVAAGIKRIETGGVLVDFLFVDMIGMVIPRTYQAFTRNREELEGKLNIKNGIEELIREMFSGPCMFVIPMIFGLVSRKVFGRASQIQFKALDSLTDSFGRVLNRKNIPDDKTHLKKEFYKNIFNETFEEHRKIHLENPINLDAKVEKLSTLALNIEKGEKVKENTAEINKIVSDINKAHGIHLENSHNLTLKDGLVKEAGSLAGDLVNYSKDIVEKIAKHTDEYKSSYLEKLHTSKIRGRRINTALTILATSAFLYSIPIMYQRNKQFPGLNGLIKNDKNKDKKSPVQKTKEEKESFGKNSTSTDSYFDFNGNNVPYPVMAFYTLGLMLGCRWFQARNEDEKREVATRDFSGLVTIVFAVPILRNITSTLMRKSSGVPISKIIKSIKNHFNPTNKPFSFENIKDVYSGVSKYRNGIVDFAQNIDNLGGDLRKTFNFLGDDSKKALNAIAEKLSQQNTTVKSGDGILQKHFKAGKSELRLPENNKKIIEILEKAKDDNELKHHIETITKELDNSKNHLVKFAEAQKSIPEAISIIGVSAFLGWFLPWFNINYTKKLYKNKNAKAEQAQLEIRK